MSYILDALKKAELQRDLGQVPGIGSEHEKPPRQVSGKWLGVVVVFLVLNLVLLVWLLWPDAGPGTDEGYRTGLEQPGSVFREPTLVREPPPVVAPPVVAPPVATPPSAVPVRPAVPETIPAPVVADPFEAPPALVEPEPLIELPPAVQPVVEEDAGNEIDSLPVWPQIPDHMFRQIRGGIRLDVHVYSDLPQDRFVLINLQKYHAGDQLQEGPLLDEITPEGVILSFQGQQFRVRAQ